MLTIIIQVILCLFVMTACVISIISEYKRNKQMTEIYNRLIKKYNATQENKDA